MFAVGDKVRCVNNSEINGINSYGPARPSRLIVGQIYTVKECRELRLSSKQSKEFANRIKVHGLPDEYYAARFKLVGEDKPVKSVIERLEALEARVISQPDSAMQQELKDLAKEVKALQEIISGPNTDQTNTTSDIDDYDDANYIIYSTSRKQYLRLISKFEPRWTDYRTNAMLFTAKEIDCLSIFFTDAGTENKSPFTKNSSRFSADLVVFNEDTGEVYRRWKEFF